MLSNKCRIKVFIVNFETLAINISVLGYFFGSVYFAFNGIIAFRSILPQLGYIHATVFTNSIVNPRSHESELNRSESKPPKP